jgi:AMP-dependent synthetase/ligase
MNDNFVKSEKVYMKYDKIKSFINLLLKYIKQNDSLLDDSVCIFTQDSILDILILIALNRAGKNGILIEKDAKYEEIVRRAKLVKSNTIIVCNQNLREDYFTIFNIAEEKDLLVTGSFNYKIDKEDDISSSYAIICTSGSTDLPKLVYKQNKIIEEHAKLLQKLYELTTEDTVLIIVPCQHAYGLEHFMAAFKSGANIIVQNEFNIGEILELILNEAISVIVGSPYQYVFIDRAIHNVLEIDNLRMLLSAGMAMEEKISLSLEKKCNTKVIQVYGSSEISAAMTNKDSGIHDSIGQPLDGIETILKKNIDENNYELLIKSPFVAEKVVDGENITFYNKDTWICTGDFASLDKNGNIFIQGRKDNIINLAGKKVNPEEVERVLMEFGGIQECYVYERDGEIVADLVSERGVKFNNTDIVNHCKKHIQNYKIPTKFFMVKSIGKTATGKIERK